MLGQNAHRVIMHEIKIDKSEIGISSNESWISILLVTSCHAFKGVILIVFTYFSD